MDSAPLHALRASLAASCPHIPSQPLIASSGPEPSTPIAPPELQHILEPHELAVVASNANRPLAALQAMSRTISAAGLDPIATSRLDINLETFEVCAVS
jgi:hypothetical protein